MGEKQGDQEVMRYGAILENNPIRVPPDESSYRKLSLMRASAVGTLWTAGTHHRREVYERCESLLDKPFYLIRVGGHYQTPGQWFGDAGDALAELPKPIINENRFVLVAGNEPNNEGWPGNPWGYAEFYRVVAGQTCYPVAFACPSLGWPDWRGYLDCSIVPSAKWVSINAYAHLVGEVPAILARFRQAEGYIGEVNTLEGNRVPWLRTTFQNLANWGIKASLVFIAGGKSGGTWDEGYILSQAEAAGLAGEYEAVLPPSLPPDPTTGGGEMDQITTWLADMWRRQGVEPSANAFWDYAVRQGHEQGRAIVPMLSPDGQFYSVTGNYILAYTLPVPLWCENAPPYSVHEGFPPLA